MDNQVQHQQSIHRSHSSKCRAPPPPPPAIQSASIVPVTPMVLSNSDQFCPGTSCSLPETFVSSLRQLFSILDKTKSGHVPFDVFKRYWTPTFTMESSSSTTDILNELEMESKSKNYFITFDLLLSVIERSITTTSDSSISSMSTPPPIVVPKVKRPNSSICFPLNRSTSVVVVNSSAKKVDQHQIPSTYRSYNVGIERNQFDYNDCSTSSNGLIRQRKKVHCQKVLKQMNDGSAEHQTVPTRRNSIHSNEIDFAMIRALKRYEIERDLLVQTCDTLDRVKSYLIDRLLEMKDKQHSYSIQLSAAETTGIAPESIYNRDLVADLFKLANTVLLQANFDSKKCSDRPSNGTVNHQFHQQLKYKEDRIKQLETEKRILLKELVEMRHQYRTVVPTKP